VTESKTLQVRCINLARAIEQSAVLACPGIGLVALAQIGVLDGILDVVIVAQVPADLFKTTNCMRKKENTCGRCKESVQKEKTKGCSADCKP
jgi:hypothetical protein